MKKLVFKETIEPNIGGYCGAKCKLDMDIDWPVNNRGEKLLHLASFPLSWIDCSYKQSIFISIFTPFDKGDEYKHWETLTDGIENESKILINKNNGMLRDEFGGLDSNQRSLELIDMDGDDDEKNYTSKISNKIAWLQDKEAVEGYECKFMLDGNDFDKPFKNFGLFSDGYVYAFLCSEIDSIPAGKAVGKITFQFS